MCLLLVKIGRSNRYTFYMKKKKILKTNNYLPIAIRIIHVFIAIFRIAPDILNGYIILQFKNKIITF